MFFFLLRSSYINITTDRGFVLSLRALNLSSSLLIYFTSYCINHSTILLEVFRSPSFPDCSRASDRLGSLVRIRFRASLDSPNPPISRAPRSRAAEFRPGRRRFGPLRKGWPRCGSPPNFSCPRAELVVIFGCALGFPVLSSVMASVFQGMERRGLLRAALLLCCFLAVCSGRGESSHFLTLFLFIDSTMFYRV